MNRKYRKSKKSTIISGSRNSTSSKYSKSKKSGYSSKYVSYKPVSYFNSYDQYEERKAVNTVRSIKSGSKNKNYGKSVRSGMVGRRSKIQVKFRSGRKVKNRVNFGNSKKSNKSGGRTVVVKRGDPVVINKNGKIVARNGDDSNNVDELSGPVNTCKEGDFGVLWTALCNPRGGPQERCLDLPPPDEIEGEKLVCYQTVQDQRGVFLRALYGGCESPEWRGFEKGNCQIGTN